MQTKNYFLIVAAFALLALVSAWFSVSFFKPEMAMVLVGTACGIIMSVPVSFVLLGVIHYWYDHADSAAETARTTHATVASSNNTTPTRYVLSANDARRIDAPSGKAIVRK